ncbi:MAG: tRNA lysidine(34) synthetase TilS, partial [Vicinamibacteria bacterium]
DHVKALLALASTERGALSLPGQHATRRGGRIELVREVFEGFANSFRYPLSIPGEVILESQGWAISAEAGAVRERPAAVRERSAAIRERPAAIRERPDVSLTAAVRADSLVHPLSVRSRAPGDRFQPPGLGGRRKKLQDFLVDRKVARETRDLLPLVVDGEDRIVWIVGHAVGEDFRVTEPSQGVIFLKARRLGGPG